MLDNFIHTLFTKIFSPIFGTQSWKFCCKFHFQRSLLKWFTWYGLSVGDQVGLSFQCKVHLFKWKDFHHKKKLLMRPSYVYDGNSLTGKTMPLIEMAPSLIGRVSIVLFFICLCLIENITPSYRNYKSKSLNWEKSSMLCNWYILCTLVGTTVTFLSSLS